MLKKIVSIALSIGVFYSSHSFGLTQDFNEGVDYYKAGRYDLAVQKFTIGAKAGDPASQSLLASMYSQGQGVSWYSNC
jgi:TPR repeat protein